MLGLGKKGARAALESEITKKQSRLAALEHDLASAQSAAADAAAERQRTLIEGTAPAKLDDPAAIALRAKVAHAEEIRNAVDALRADVTALQARLTAEIDRVEREQVAGEIEQNAATIDERAVALDDASPLLGELYDALLSAVRAGGSTNVWPMSGPYDVSRQALAAVVHKVCPLLLSMNDAAAAAPSAATLVRGLQTDRMRELAAAICNGTAPAALPPAWPSFQAIATQPSVIEYLRPEKPTADTVGTPMAGTEIVHRDDVAAA